MASVGTLRTFGAPAPLTLFVRPTQGLGMPTASQVAMGIYGGLFIAGWLLGVVAWYHSARMFASRQGGLVPYFHPLWFLIDKYLDKDGIKHRTKFGRYIAASVVCFVGAYALRELSYRVI